MKSKKQIAFGVIILTVLVVGVYFADNSHKKANAKVIEDNERYFDLLAENCRCIVKDTRKCFDGFELSTDGKRCKAEGKWTFVLIQCSKYDCDGEIVNLNNETGFWEPVLNFEGNENA